MLASQMICMPCGHHGCIDTQEISIENSKSNYFKYLGHNPCSGVIHYQCPECNSCLNVDPMDILKMDTAIGQPDPGRPEKDPYSVSVDTAKFLWQLPGMIKDGVLSIRKYISKNRGLTL